MILQTVTKGLTMFGETVVSSLTGSKTSPPVPVSKKEAPNNGDNYTPGCVTVIDIQNVEGEVRAINP